jgi:putative sugar O-methyltransferase
MVRNRFFIFLSLLLISQKASAVNQRPIDSTLMSQTPTEVLDWQLMQKKYSELLLNNSQQEESCKSYYHPQWAASRNTLQQLIKSPYNQNFLKISCINGTMVRTETGLRQYFETLYLQKCISDSTKILLHKISDTTFGHLPKDCKEFDCSVNTLGHLFYTGRLLEALKNTSYHTVIELGGGYGNFARLFKQAQPNTTFIIIDLPEMSALQFFFIKTTLPQADVIFHTSCPLQFETNKIHIVPIYFLTEAPLSADVFVSTFALSECSQILQELICKKEFFNAKLTYITGQLDGWGATFNYVNHHYIFEALQKSYKSVVCQPFYSVPQYQLNSYEIIASNL